MAGVVAQHRRHTLVCPDSDPDREAVARPFGQLLALDCAVASRNEGAKPMTFTFNAMLLQPLVALLAGILILIVPRILNYVVAVYLIFVGVTGLWPHLLSGLAH
jgi:hypothetical protein